MKRRLLILPFLVGITFLASLRPVAGLPPEPTLPYCYSGSCFQLHCQCPPGTPNEGTVVRCGSGACY